jgi:hypothetical protein
MSQFQRPSNPEEWFHVRAAFYVETQLLFHLNQKGVFSALYAHGPLSPEDLANQLQLQSEPLSIMLDYIEGVDHLIERDPKGRFHFTEFGLEVCKRYGRDTPEGRKFNFFDVRAGAYGPVWSGADGLLDGTTPYGKGIERRGELAAGALYKSAHAMAPALHEILASLQVDTAVEWGVETGLLECMAEQSRSLTLMGLDRSENEINKAAELAKGRGIDTIDWIHANLFEPENWVKKLPTTSKGAFFSIHMHEFAGMGTDAVESLLRTLHTQCAGWYLIAMEQPRLSMEAREDMPASRWLYSQANVLIHHLIKNGKVLSEDQWTHCFETAGCTVEKILPVNFLDYKAFVVRL